jgi:ribonuclease HI
MKTKLVSLSIDFKAGLHVFADGACHPNPGPGGWAFVVYQDGAEIHQASGAAPWTTNNRMELNAVLAALEWVSEHAPNSAACLHSDSSYAVLGCNQWRKNWKKKGWRKSGGEIPNADLWKLLDELLSAAPVQLNWVRGHSGITGNVRADRLAELARRSQARSAA